MHIEQEKNNVFTPQETYEIISAAIDMADDDGFVNSYVFERALYVCAARTLYEDKADEINSSLLEDGSPLITWKKLLDEEVIEHMVVEHSESLDYLATLGQNWFEEYTEAAHSLRSLVDVIQTLMDGMAGNMGKQLDMIKQDTDIKNVMEIADKWGLDRDGGSLLGE
jgi:hypothetical protein